MNLSELTDKIYAEGVEKGNAEAQYRAARIYEQKMLAETRQNKRDEYKKLAENDVYAWLVDEMHKMEDGLYF